MKKEILYKGFCKQKNKNVIGYYIKHANFEKVKTPNLIFNLEDKQIYPIEEKSLKEYVGIDDKNGNKIFAGEKFTFSYLKELKNPIRLIGSFNWNNDDLRYEIDIDISDEFVCLSYVGNGTFFDFELIKE